MRVIETSSPRRPRVQLLDMETVEESDDASVDVLIDATGNPDSMARAFARARFGAAAQQISLCSRAEGPQAPSAVAGNAGSSPRTRLAARCDRSREYSRRLSPGEELSAAVLHRSRHFHPP